MKHLLLALMLATVTGCAGGVDTEVACPGKDQELSRQQWEACYGYQDHDASGGSD